MVGYVNFIVQPQLLFNLHPNSQPIESVVFSNSAWDQLSLDGTESFSLREKGQSSVGSDVSGNDLGRRNVFVPAKLLQSCQTLCNPMDYSPPGSFVHGILQARILD